MVDEITPPITTVASGRCTSAPALVATAIGMKPAVDDRADERCLELIGRKTLIALHDRQHLAVLDAVADSLAHLLDDPRKAWRDLDHRFLVGLDHA